MAIVFVISKVRRFGCQTKTVENQYFIEQCLLCRSGYQTVTLPPLTAGLRIACIDGGGTKGHFPLRFLAIMQGILGDSCLLQDLFDNAYGTSVG